MSDHDRIEAVKTTVLEHIEDIDAQLLKVVGTYKSASGGVDLYLDADGLNYAGQLMIAKSSALQALATLTVR